MKKTSALLLTILLLFAARAAGAGTAYVRSVTHERDAGRERVRIGVAGDISWKSAVLGKSGGSGSYRLYVDIMGSQPTRRARTPAQPASELIRRIRVAPRDTNTTRVVLELAAPLDLNAYSVSRSTDGRAVVVDIPRSAAPPRRAVAAAADQKPGIRETPAGEPARPDRQNRVDAPATQPAGPDSPTPWIIVIDPGHGGRDPGATGWGGVREKDIALAIALELKKMLDADRGCRVIMTRTTDTFISLEDRAAIANHNRANLLISIHANAHEDSRLRGTETYYLDFSSDADARGVAARENFTTPEELGDLELILFDLQQSDKIKRSSILAGHVHNAMMRSLKAKYRDIRNLGVKHAPMKVLIEADMPCLIIEAAFLSNPVEARRLQKPGHQRLLARAITAGITSFLRGAQSAARARAGRAGM